MKKNMLLLLVILVDVLGTVAWLKAEPAEAPAPSFKKGSEEFEDFAELPLESLLNTVTSAAKHEQDILESPSSVTVISHEEIENSPCLDLPCVMRQIPEVEVRTLTPMYSVIGLRAVTQDPGERVLVLLDGFEVNLEVLGPATWNDLPVHLEEIERIEVIRGPGSALYGANAYAGVISIITRRANQSGGEAFFGVQERGGTNLHLGWSQILGGWTLSLSGGHENSGSWQQYRRQEHDLNRIRARLERSSDTSSTMIELSLTTPEGLLSAGVVAPIYIHDSLSAHFQVVHQNDRILARINLMAIDFKSDLQLPLEVNGVKLGELPPTISIFSSTIDTELQSTWRPFQYNLLIVGGNYRWITFLSDLNQPKTNHQHRVGLFLHDEHRLLQSLMLTAGVRLDYNNITPFTVSPRLALVWRFDPDQSVRLSFGQAFRKPSFLNTSFHITGVKGDPSVQDFFKKNLGNENLGNERILSFETGYLGRFWEEHLALEGDLFFTLYRDTINLVADYQNNSLGMPDLSKSVLQYFNDGMEANSIGGSISAVLRIHSLLRLSCNYTFRYSWYVSIPTNNSLEQRENQGDRVSFEPAHLLNASVSYSPEFGLRTGATANLSSSRTNLTSVRGELLGQYMMMRLPEQLLFNVFVAWRQPVKQNWIEAGVRAINLFNNSFRDVTGMFLPNGRSVGAEQLCRTIFLYIRGTL